MNTSYTRALRNASAGAAVLLAALGAQAADLGQDNYRRVVLGDTSIGAPAAPVSAEQVVPGSYARYLIVNGMDSGQAIATARAAGEATTSRSAAPVAANRLDGQQRYEQLMGIAG